MWWPSLKSRHRALRTLLLILSLIGTGGISVSCISILIVSNKSQQWGTALLMPRKWYEPDSGRGSTHSFIVHRKLSLRVREHACSELTSAPVTLSVNMSDTRHSSHYHTEGRSRGGRIMGDLLLENSSSFLQWE